MSGVFSAWERARAEERERQERQDAQVLRRLSWHRGGRTIPELARSLEWTDGTTGIRMVLRRLEDDERAVRAGDRWYLPEHAPGPPGARGVDTGAESPDPAPPAASPPPPDRADLATESDGGGDASPEGEESTMSDPVDVHSLTPRLSQIYRGVRDTPGIRARELSEALGVSRGAAEAALHKLRRMGILESAEGAFTATDARVDLAPAPEPTAHPGHEALQELERRTAELAAAREAEEQIRSALEQAGLDLERGTVQAVADLAREVVTLRARVDVLEWAVESDTLRAEGDAQAPAGWAEERAALDELLDAVGVLEHPDRRVRMGALGGLAQVRLRLMLGAHQTGGGDV